MNLIEITLAGFKKLVPEAALTAWKSFGWERVEAKPQALTPEAKPKKTTRKAK
jgi:hypothetical protein